MTDFARLVLEADTKGLKRGERDLEAVGRQSQRTAGDVDRAAGGMASAFKRVGAALLAAGITTVLYDFGKRSAKAAIDAEEMGNAFNVVFGGMADDVEAWAETTGNALGRSTQEIMRGALAFQELFGKALDPAQSAEMSKQFAVLTQDLASFKNLSNEVAQQKLFSGLVGEAEPLRAVGVFLNEAAVQAKAAELGLSGVNGVLTDQEKIVARAAIINEQLAAAQGDVERTSGSTANQIKTMNAAVEELQVAIGQKLLPALTPVITLTAEFTTALANAAQQIQVNTNRMADFIEGVRVISGWVGRAASAVATFANKLGLTIERLQWFGDQINFIVNPLSRVVALIERIGGDSRARDRINAVTTDAGLMMRNINEALAGANSAGALIQTSGAVGAISTKMQETGRAANDMGDRFQSLMDRIYPEVTRLRTLREELALLQGSLSGDSLRDAESRLRFDAAGESATGKVGLSDEVREALFGQGSVGGLDEGMKSFQRFNDRMRREAQTTSVTVVRTFREMTEQTLSALDRMAGAIRGGGFLDILNAVVGVGLQLGSIGVFGKSFGENINSAPSGKGGIARLPSADGGGYTGSGARSGGMDGKGGFLAMLHPQETVIDHTRGRRAANDVNVTVTMDASTGQLAAFVRNEAGQVVAQAAPSIGQAASAHAVNSVVRMQNRRLA